MVFKNTSTNPKALAGFTLVELFVALGISGLVALVIVTVAYFSGQSFIVMGQYADLGLKNQMALDRMSRQIRQARRVTAFTGDSITLLDQDGASVQFVHNANTRTLYSIKGGLATPYLTGCDSLRFLIYQHTPISNTFACYDPAFVTNARLVTVTWTCSRNTFASQQVTEGVQAANIAIRNH